MATILPISDSLTPAIVEDVTSCLRQAGVLAVATESSYALAAGIDQARAVERVAVIKGQRDIKPLLILVGEWTQLDGVVESFPPGAERLMRRFWPGPLTLVLPAISDLPHPLTCGTATIGVRQPQDRRLLTLLQATGPMTGTSANRAGDIPAQTAAAVQQQLGSDIDLILDSGPSPGGPPSTVLTLVGEYRVLRKGPVSAETIQEVLSDIGLCLHD